MIDKKAELQTLFEANSELNSPKACADRKQMALLQNLCKEETKTMNPEELSDLAKVRNEADEELRLFQKIQAEHQPVEPLEVIPIPDNDFEKIADELKDIAQDMSEYHSEYRENRRADSVKAEKDKKHNFRHDFLVAAFSVALTLFFEHLHDIIEFVLEFFRSLL